MSHQNCQNKDFGQLFATKKVLRVMMTASPFSQKIKQTSPTFQILNMNYQASLQTLINQTQTTFSDNPNQKNILQKKSNATFTFKRSISLANLNKSAQSA